MGGWAGFRFGLARLSWGFGNSGASGSTGTSVSTSTPASKIATNTPNEPSASNTSNNSNSGPSSNAFPSRLDLDRNFGIDATSSESGDESSNNSTDTEGRGIDSPSPLDYDRVYGYDEDAYGQIPNSAFPSASPYPGSGDGYGYEDDSLDSIGEGELIPGQYRALYSFEPEGPSEMKLTEGDIVMVVGRGGGGGWAVVLDKYTEHSPRDVEPGGTTNPNVTSKYALVPESYLELIQPDEAADREAKEEKGTVTTPEARQ
ncbi:hypothetical protein F5051DRAFT_423086 [Lentinula edodes]|nr:hypothetical protein F5051DRAFT_423086 [Lentinula edodes]